jgi:hypothetical protein
MGRQQRVARQHVRPSIPVRQDLPAQLQGAEAAGRLLRLVAIGHDSAGCGLGAVARHRLGVRLLPLQFTQPGQEVLARAGDGGLDAIETGRSPVGRRIGQIRTRK